MNIMTIGMSPYLLKSNAKINALILENLYLQGNPIGGIVFGHDTSFFLPEESNGQKQYFYNFDKFKIPIIPIDNTKDPVVPVYELLNHYKPDLVITVGDYNDFLFMKAVKMFCNHPFKWLAVCLHHSLPINENNIELMQDMDAVLCSNTESFNEFSKNYSGEILEMCHIGYEKAETSRIQSDKFVIMTCGKNAQVDNLPVLMEAVRDIKHLIPNVELYVHSNIHDSGDFDIDLLKQRFDPNGEFIRFPDKYVSLAEGYTREKYLQELSRADIFVSTSMIAPTALSVFEAISCGCTPLMSDVGCHQDIANMFSNYDDYSGQRDDFLISCVELMGVGEVYLNICVLEDLKKKIIKLNNMINKKGGRTNSCKEVILGYDQESFVKKITDIVDRIKTLIPTLCVESV